MKIKKSKTARGFKILSFSDNNGVECSLQESSAAEECHIWIGCDDPNIKQGPPWKPFEIPDNCTATTRMHLTRRQVKQLLPHLKKFVETGVL